MASEADKHDYVEQVEKRDSVAFDAEKSQPVSVEDGEVTFKTKMAVLALILMYESYLFTLLM